MSLTSLVLKFAAPAPRIEAFQRYLFVGPHPDDIEIGAGATAARLAESGRDVAFLICLDGRFGDGFSGGVTGEELIRTRREEAVRSAEILGVRNVRFLGRKNAGTRVQACTAEEMENAEPLCDGGFYGMDDLIGGIADAVRRFQPDLIFGPDPLSRSECHADHLNVGSAVRQTACFAPYEGIMSRYAGSGPEEGGRAGADVKAAAFYFTARPNRYVKTNGELMKKQLDAVRAHRSQFPGEEEPLKSIRTYLRLRSADFGLRRGRLHAEGFRVYSAVQMHCLPEAGE